MILLATANRKHMATETDRTHLDTGSGCLRKCNGRWVGQCSYNPSPISLGWNKVSTKHIICHVCRSVNFVWWPVVTSIAFAHPLILIQGWHNSCAMAKKRASQKQKAKKQDSLARASKDFEWVESNMGMNDAGQFTCLACSKTYAALDGLVNHAKRQHRIKASAGNLTTSVNNEANQVRCWIPESYDRPIGGPRGR